MIISAPALALAPTDIVCTRRMQGARGRRRTKGSKVLESLVFSSEREESGRWGRSMLAGITQIVIHASGYGE